MKEFQAIVFTIMSFIVIIFFIVSLIKPNIKPNKQLLKTSSRKRLTAYYLSAIFALFVTIGIVAPSQPANKPNNSYNSRTQNQKTSQDFYTVTNVVDGDTIEININGKTERLRLIGIDTPETVDPRKPVQCFGKEASNKAKELLEGKKISLESDASQENRDKYNRLLRYVYLEDGTSYNKLIISEGYAHEYTYNIPYKYQAQYKKAQKDAEDAKKGLWSPTTCAGDTEKSVTATATIAPQPNTTPSNLPQVNSSNNCDPNYSPCIPNVSQDLDCGDINTSVKVIGTDRHRFDRDGDGYGCESN